MLHLKEVLLLVLLVTVGKAFIFSVIVRIFRYGNVIPIAVGLGLFQIGEFTFVTSFRNASISSRVWTFILILYLYNSCFDGSYIYHKNSLHIHF